MTLMMGLTIYDRQVRLCGDPDASVPAVHESAVFPGSSGCSGTRCRKRTCALSLSQRGRCVCVSLATSYSRLHCLLCDARCAKSQNTKLRFHGSVEFADTSPGVGAVQQAARFRQDVSYQTCCRCFLHPLTCPLPSFVHQHPLLPRFKGVGLIAPAIQGNPPPAPVVAALRYLVAPIIPRRQIPDALESGTWAVIRLFSQSCFLVVRIVFPSHGAAAEI